LGKIAAKKYIGLQALLRNHILRVGSFLLHPVGHDKVNVNVMYSTDRKNKAEH